MIEFFTALVISYTVGGEPMQTFVLYDQEDHCYEAMRLVDPLYDQLYTLYGKDIMISCEVTEEVSRYPIRPKVRP